MTESPPQVPATVFCANCEHEVPVGNFCVRCGDSLSDELQAAAGRPRRGFAANPQERRLTPSIVSTIFPQLPRADLDSFRLGLVAGVVTMVVLALLKLFPLALIGSAV